MPNSDGVGYTRICYQCEGGIEISGMATSWFGNTRLAESLQMVIPREGFFFYPSLTRKMNSFPRVLVC